MDSNRLKNCAICGKLFLKVHTDHCLECYKKIEEEFELVNGFLKIEDNRLTTLEEVKKATGVSAKRLTEFIRDGRIFAGDYPNLGYPCNRCGKLIKRQILCNSCFDEFATDVNRVLKSEQLAESMGKKTESHKQRGYWHIKNSK
ncbi:flagellar protein [Planomicrobium sp. CPCC 101110]|uniref:flagellar protein n=1 Tax=Planomicrobium sp. CPCC 101110 TaxID=2599619 RepID=UPI0011B3A3B0|nr:flagellar protein [Planomicrobium sp. CPCC 101110]TWT27815.1 flagellar protein [Planomicrobium sp. CPCC 101110]